MRMRARTHAASRNLESERHSQRSPSLSSRHQHSARTLQATIFHGGKIKSNATNVVKTHKITLLAIIADSYHCSCSIYSFSFLLNKNALYSKNQARCQIISSLMNWTDGQLGLWHSSHTHSHSYTRHTHTEKSTSQTNEREFEVDNIFLLFTAYYRLPTENDII